MVNQQPNTEQQPSLNGQQQHATLTEGQARFVLSATEKVVKTKDGQPGVVCDAVYTGGQRRTAERLAAAGIIEARVFVQRAPGTWRMIGRFVRLTEYGVQVRLRLIELMQQEGLLPALGSDQEGGADGQG